MTLYVLLGPTAVGKTELALQMAEKLGSPILNCDSRQIYRGMEIGTAAPTAEQQRRVKHYFVGTHDIGSYYSAAQYEQDVLALIAQLSGTHQSLLLTGGSMMYLDAVCNGIDDIPTIRDDIREEMKRRYQEEGLVALCEDLRRLDPEHYEIVDKQNYRRVIHALEICYQTGLTYTSFRKQEKKARPFRIVKIGLNRERDILYNRINARVDEMIKNGLLEEAQSLYGKRQLNALNTVGYKEMFDYMDGRWSLEEGIERMKGNTRRYARKQLTWFKRDPEVKWFDADNKEDIIKYITQYE